MDLRVLVKGTGQVLLPTYRDQPDSRRLGVRRTVIGDSLPPRIETLRWIIPLEVIGFAFLGATGSTLNGRIALSAEVACVCGTVTLAIGF